MKRALLVPICLLLIACGLSGCDDDDDVTFVNDYYTGLRVIHAGYDAPPAAVFLNGALVVDSLEFGESSGYALVLSDVYDMEITPADGETAELVSIENLVLMPLEVITVFAVGARADLRPLITEDSRFLLDGRARARFVHASPDAPAVDLRIDSADGTQIFQGVSFPRVTDYTALDPGDYVFVVTAAGNTDPLAAFDDVALETGTLYTIAALGTLNGDDEYDFMVRVYTDNGDGAGFADLTPAAAVIPD